MDTSVSIQSFVERFVPGSHVHWTSLSQRRGRVVIKVTSPKGSIVLRASNDYEKLNNEYKCQRFAHMCDVSAFPSPMEQVDANWHYFSESFIGEPKRVNPLKLASDRTLARLAERLAEYHQALPTQSSTRVHPSTYNRLVKWIESSQTLGIQLSKRQKKLPDLLARYAPEIHKGLVHGDLRAANLVEQSDCLYLIDFEHAGLGDVGFDLAKLIASNTLPREKFKSFATLAYGRDAKLIIEVADLYREVHIVAVNLWKFLQKAEQVSSYETKTV
jgi:thiamine kinase-like enzyme